jgi:hypothetical protein
LVQVRTLRHLRPPVQQEFYTITSLEIVVRVGGIKKFTKCM